MTMNAQKKDAPKGGADELSVQSLIDEINEEVKAKQITDFLKRYGNYIIAALLATVVGTAGINTWANMRVQQQEADSAKLIALIDADTGNLSEEETKEALKAYITLGKEAPSEGHKVVARFAEVAVLLKKGEGEAGFSRLAELRAEPGLAPVYRDYTLLLEARARMDKDEPQKVLDLMKPILTEGNPWHLSATEVAAMLHAKMGQKDKAVELLKMIVEADGIAAAARERAQQLLRLYRAP